MGLNNTESIFKTKNIYFKDSIKKLLRIFKIIKAINGFKTVAQIVQETNIQSSAVKATVQNLM